MSARNRARKEQNRGYRIAGKLYWTNDMEKIIRRIRRERTLYGVICLIEIGIIIFEGLALTGVL